MKFSWLVPATLAFCLGACSGIYCGAMETLGVHERDIKVGRVRAARMVRNDREE